MFSLTTGINIHILKDMDVAFFQEPVLQRKGDKTRQFIISSSKVLFTQKGYSGVTMQDICEKCRLSRGGLYRHFGSAKEIMIEILRQEIREEEQNLNRIIAWELAPDTYLNDMFRRQKKVIMNGGARLNSAFYEFSVLEPDQYPLLKRRYDAAEKNLSVLIEYGKRTGVFRPCDADAAARHIIFCLEGLLLSSIAVPIAGRIIDEQIRIMTGLVLKEGRSKKANRKP